MPSSKFSHIRYQVLDKCLSDHTKPYRIDDLVEACNKALTDHMGEFSSTRLVSKRTVQADLEFLQRENSYQIPLERVQNSLDKRVIYFRYADPEFSINKKPLASHDAEIIRSALETIRSFKGLPQFDWVENATNLIDQWTTEKENDSTIILFDGNQYLEGQQHIETLYHAIQNQRPQTINYKPFDKPEEMHQVSPYLLKQYNNRWFVLCHSDLHEHLINLALDRILKLSASTHDFLPYPEEAPKDFFDDIIGVTRLARKIETIELEVRSDLYPYLKTKPIHPSQTLKQKDSNEKWKKITLKLIPNYEFYSVILSHGPRIKILAPLEVREEFTDILLRSYHQYF